MISLMKYLKQVIMSEKSLTDSVLGVGEFRSTADDVAGHDLSGLLHKHCTFVRLLISNIGIVVIMIS